MTHASRDTTTGLKFEEKVQIEIKDIDITKHELYRYLKSQKIDYKTIISKKLLPDAAYIDTENSCLMIYEKKFQKTNGSVDEKLQTCGFKLWQYKKIAKALGLKDVKFIYILNDWFKKPEYKDTLEWIRLQGCDYFFFEGD